MSWAVTVNNLQEYEDFPLELEEYFASQHASYPRDARIALTIAKLAGLRSATLCGMRTPNPYGGDEIVDISVRGTPIYQDFLREMSEIIASGPSPDSDLAKHYSALARLREHPCSHVWDLLGDGTHYCTGCNVHLNGTMLYFEDNDG